MTTTPASKTFAPIRGKAVRITRLDSCGVPIVGAASSYVSKGFIKVQLKMNWAKATDITVTTADNALTINEPGLPQLASIAADVSLTQVNPDVMSLLTGYQTQLDGMGASVGYRGSSGIQLTSSFALEVWSDIAGAQCVGARPYGYLLLPFLRGAQISDWSIDNGAATVGFSATTHEGSGWGVGPYSVVDTDTTGTTPSPGKLLVPVGAKDQFHMQLTTVAPPAETDGLTALTGS